MSNTFKINDVEIKYAREAHNNAWENERSVEVALGRYFLDNYGSEGPHNPSLGKYDWIYDKKPVLEVGCVMPYYGREGHDVVDLCDDHKASHKGNALDLDYTGRNVLCLSTIEHMHKKEYSNGSDEDGVTCLKKILTSAHRYLITFPTQYNEALTAYLSTHPEVPRFILRRINWKNEYVKHEDSNDFSIPFGHSDRPIPAGFWNNANGVVVVTNLSELL